jgi:general secretion pathway protein E
VDFEYNYLLSMLKLDQESFDAYLQKANESGVSVENILFEDGLIDEEMYLCFISKIFDIEYVKNLANLISSSSGWVQDNEIVCGFSLHWLRKHSVVPVRQANGKMRLAIAKPSGWLVGREMELALGQRFSKPVLTESESIQNIINQAFGESTHRDDSTADFLGDGEAARLDFDDHTVQDILGDTSEAPFIRFVNMILAQAVRAGASDIHIEPYRDQSRVRFRLDGVLYERHKLSKSHHAAVVSRIKVMAKLNIAEKRLSQDGRISISLGGRQIGLRVSTLPTSFGERVVMRLLEKSERVMSLSELGLGRHGIEMLRSLAKCSHGMVLVTGPTGSGKTTTLYAVLQEIAAPDRNILTIEDPVEYELDGVGQMQVNSKIGLNFADGLRSLVRQDPDVILIGEIRDRETATIAIQSALTGHLVFSTLHTNDAPSAIARLLDMGVESFLLSSVLRGVVAQRLVRVLCPICRKAYAPSALELEAIGQHSLSLGQHLFAATGCPECMHTGFRGRMAIYEIMHLSDSLKRLITDRADANTLRNQALKEGMQDIRYDGIAKVLGGKTSLAEIVRSIQV